MIRLLCITDPLTHPSWDATVELYHHFPADPRFQLFHLQAERLGDGVSLPVTPVPTPLDYQEFLALGAAPVERAGLADFDMVFCRTDKPYLPGYLETLVRYEDAVRFVQRPSGVRDCDTRDFYRSVASRFMPAGIVTRDLAEAGDFVRAQGRVVAKRNRTYGGKGVARIWQERGRWWIEPASGVPEAHDALEAILEQLFGAGPEPYEFVRYLDNVVAGDKRVVVVEGEIYGGYLRLAAEGGWINNQTAGGTVHRSTVTPAEAAVVDATWRAYHDRGLDLLGYDFLEDDGGQPTLSEINAGNVAGFGVLEQTDGVGVYARLLDWIHGLVRR